MLTCHLTTSSPRTFNSWVRSYNMLSLRILGEAFKQNHTVMGIHMMGNDAKVDELGFMKADGD